ncbi:MAG: thioredoxin domain-containing protein [Gemmatimonadaceae bacterium]|nr:thioredoxin domain-containing protein [Gemmatimonadaceae bacterium]
MLRCLYTPALALALLGCSKTDGAAASTRGADAASLRPDGPPAALDSSSTVLAKADAGRIIGSPSATVWMIIISDFQCPFCKQWHDESWEAIRKEYVDTGKIRVAYMNLPLGMHANATPAAHAAMCASVQGKFWPVQDAMFRTQKEWSRLSDAHPFFESLARDAGADVDALRACVKSGVMAPLIQSDEARAAGAGAQSTPTFFVGSQPLIGAQPLAAFRGAINAALAAKPAGQ